MNNSTIALQQNAVFVQTIFGDQWYTCHITGFTDDPSNIVNERRAFCWAGGHAGPERIKHGLNYDQPENQYFCISTFNLPYGNPSKDDGHMWKDVDNRPRRKKDLFRACYVIVADDVKDKVPQAQAERLPQPSYRLETSPGNEQWGWILLTPETDRDRVDNILDGLVAQGLAPDGKDPGMKGVTRYVRLPGGWNTKAKYGTPFRCQLLEWEPARRVTLEQLAEPFGIDLNRRRNNSSTGSCVADPNHPVLKVFSDNKMVLNDKGNGTVLVICPWYKDHTDKDTSGTAIFTYPNGTAGFKCHHGHCDDVDWEDIHEWCEEQSMEFDIPVEGSREYETQTLLAGITLPGIG